MSETQSDASSSKPGHLAEGPLAAKTATPREKKWGELSKKIAATQAKVRALERRVKSIEASRTYKLSRLLANALPWRRVAAAVGLTVAPPSDIEHHRRKLAQWLQQFGFANTKVRLEASAATIAKFLHSSDVRQALDLFERDVASAFALLKERAPLAKRVSKRSVVHIGRAEAVIRCARQGIDLPEPATGPMYEAIDRKVFYLLHSRAPLIQNGYTSRTEFIMAALKFSGLDPVGVTRLGFPNDLAAFRKTQIAEDEVDGGMRFVALADKQGGRLNRSVDDFITAYADRVVELALRDRPAVLHAASNYLNGLAAIHAGRRMGIPTIFEVRGYWHITQASLDEDHAATEDFRLAERMEIDAARGADRVITISQALKQHLADRAIDPGKIFVVPNGADTDVLKPMARDVGLADQLGISNDAFVIGYVGSLVEYEGLDVLIKAVAKLKQTTRHNLVLLIVGGGKAADALRALAISSGIGEHCLFTGPVPKDKVRSYYSLIDIAPFPRRLLPVTMLVPPLKPLEALAMGKAVLLSDLPVLSELGKDGESAIHFKHDDVDALAHALTTIRESPELLRKLGAAGRQWVVEHRSLPSTAQRLEDVYASVGVFKEPVVRFARAWGNRSIGE